MLIEHPPSRKCFTPPTTTMTSTTRAYRSSNNQLRRVLISVSSRIGLVCIVLVCSLTLLPTSMAAASVPDDDGIRTLSESLDQRLAAFLERSSDYDVIQQSYRSAAAESLTFAEFDGAELVQNTATLLGEIFDKNMKALRRAAIHAEDLTTQYTWRPKVKEIDYVYAKEINISLDYNDEFKNHVSFENSSVHIPIDIYRKDAKILHTLAWTKDMDEIWKQNHEADDSLSWQYFGSQTGVLRTFPASKWEVPDPDLYDVRRRPWYTQGASSPKEMLILIDTSGSCHGQALALMKHAIVSIVDTLSDNDFVNVANFSDHASLVGCFQTFVQANPRNKKKLIQYVQTLHANGVANYHKGFEFAFQQFEKFNRTNKTKKKKVPTATLR